MPGLSRQKEEMKYPRQRSMWARVDSSRQNSMRLRLAGAFRKGGIDSGSQGEHNQKKSCHKQGKS